MPEHLFHNHIAKLKYSKLHETTHILWQFT